MASLVGEQQISTNSQPAEPVQKTESREGSVERKVAKDREEKLKLARERQNEERQRKIEELKAQAEAAQRYREQKEEERRRRIEEMRQRETEKRTQVEERKRAITEAEKERREYILRKNQERESKLESKKRERNSVAFAFGSSTPRLLEPDFGLVSPSTFLGHRRSTSISNVTGASLSRRSSERELTDSGSKKRATSASGTERHDDHRRKSSSMYEVFNWGHTNDEPPKRFSLSIVSSEINIDDPPKNATITRTTTAVGNTTTHRPYSTNNDHLTTDTTTATATASKITTTASCYPTSKQDDNVDSSSQIVFRSVARRKTDLMPTIPSPRDGHYGSRSSLSHTPRTPGRAYSMNRLDQLAQPIRRNGEHIRAILERERREQLELMDETESLGGGRRRSKKAGGSSSAGGAGASAMSRSMTHLAGSGNRAKYSLGGGISSSFRPLHGGNRDACKSLTQLSNTWSTSTTPRSNLGLQTAATKKYLQSSLASSASANKRGQQQHHLTNPYRFDPNSLLLMNSSFSVTTGSRSGNVTPGGSISTSRPGSAMSTSTNMSTSGYVARRSAPAMRKPRPASIAGTGLSLDEINKHKKDSRPPAKASTPSASAQTTPKRTSNLMSTSMIVSSTTRMSSAEKKTPAKREPATPKAATPKSLSKTPSSDRLNKAASKDANSSMSKSAYVAPTSSNSNTSTLASEKSDSATVAIVKTKDEKNASNAAKTESIEASTPEAPVPTAAQTVAVASLAEEKVDEGSEKAQSSGAVVATDVSKPNAVAVDGNQIPVSIEASANNAPKQPVVQPQSQQNDTRENSEVRELTPPYQLDTNDMTASMIAKSKITTEEEAKAALAERRRLAREEAERQAELERQRIEAERLAELKRQEEEAERQRQFEEEANRMAEAQRKAEEERLRQAIEEAKQREEEERRKREDEERQRVEREEAERKAKEEAEKQRLEVAERLKREEKEREERRKRVEAIMSRTRKAGTNASTPNSTPVKQENNDSSKANENNASTPNQAAQVVQLTNASTPSVVAGNSESSSTSGTTTTTTSPNPLIPSDLPATAVVTESQNTQAMYEQSVIDKETALINSFSNMIIDENAKNLQQQFQQQQQQQPPIAQILDVGNGKLAGGDLLHNSTTSTTVANGNGHVENINNKNDINILQDAVPPTSNQLIDLSIESQDINNSVNQFNNNNSLLTTTTTSLVTADSHENKDISLL